MSLTSHQENIHNAIVGDIINNISTPIKGYVEDHFISLTGSAGVGKSYLTTHIVQSLTFHQLCHNVCITAPTHKALKVIRNMLESYNIDVDTRTIQSFLGIIPIRDYVEGKERYAVDRTKKDYPSVSVLIVDESSMISKEIYEYIEEAFYMGRVNTVLFIGDKYQLPPNTNNISPVFELRKQYTLEEIVRQKKDSSIIKLATKFRDRIIKQNFIPIDQLLKEEMLNKQDNGEIEFFTQKEKFIEDFCKNDKWYTEDKITTTFTNRDVEDMNGIIREQYWNDHGVYKPELFKVGEMIRFKSMYSKEQAMQRKNTPSYSNGEEVIIREVQLHKHPSSKIEYWELRVFGRNDFDSIYVIDPDSKDSLNNILDNFKEKAKNSESSLFKKLYWHQFYKTRNSFADVQYKFSSTINKLQGSTYESIYIDLSHIASNDAISDDMKYRLAYVAITRASRKVKILL